MAKPDDRPDNMEKLEEHIWHTMENVDDARDYLKAYSEELGAEQKTPN